MKRTPMHNQYWKNSILWPFFAIRVVEKTTVILLMGFLLVGFLSTKSLASDTDLDGIPDQLDPCLRTIIELPQIVPGCSATDLALTPEVLSEPVIERLLVHTNKLSDHEILSEFTSPLHDTVEAFITAAHEIKHRTVCGGATSFGSTASDLKRIVRKANHRLTTWLNAQPHPTQKVDVHTSASEYLSMQIQVQELAKIALRGKKIATAFNSVCEAQEGRKQLTGVVQNLDGVKRLMRLVNSEEVVMAMGSKLENFPAENAIVTIDTTQYKDGTYFTRNVTARWEQLAIPLNVPTLYDNCLKLRVVPVQAPPSGQSNWIHHHFKGYRNAQNLYEFELGTRFAIIDEGCPGIRKNAGPNGEDIEFRYRYHLQLTYVSQGGNWTTQNLFSTTFYPDVLPSDIDPDFTATLTAKRTRQVCKEQILTLPQDDWACNTPQVIQKETYPLKIRDHFGFCSLNYDQTIFDFEDDASPAEWREGKVVEATSLFSGNISFTFSAAARKIISGTPVATTVGLNEPFAIYPKVPLPGHPYSDGVVWANITGTRNGEGFRYSCSTPKLVRDAVNYCSTLPHTYYRLPFPETYITTVGQGNNGSTTHNSNGWQWAALDLSGNEGDALVAARGGEVKKVVSNINVNCNDLQFSQGCPFFGNHVAIEHQDGSTAWYMHMVENSAAVSEGQFVNRGDFIGLLGNTGNSSGPHVHFHVEPSFASNSTSMTILARYEAAGLEFLHGIGSCFVPQEDSQYVSTN